MLLLLLIAVATACSNFFLGFKILRKFLISVSPASTKSILLIQQCHVGKAVYEHELPLSSLHEVTFETPICLHRKNGSRLWSHLFPQNAEQPLSCFKFARRRQFAKLNVMFFVPHTFVGTVFKCKSPSDCNEPEPLRPLVASDSRKHKTSVGVMPFSLNLEFPYLQTSSIWDPRFQIGPSAWTLVHPNEKYNYSSAELGLIESARDSTLMYLQLMSRPTKFAVKALNKLENEELMPYVLSLLTPEKLLQHTKAIQMMWVRALPT